MDLLTDCHAWWRLEDNLPTTVVLEQINSPSHDGELLGGNNTEDISVSGKIGLGFSLTAVDDDRVWVSDWDAADVGSGDFTVAQWLRAFYPNASQRAFCNRNSSTGYGYELTRDGSNNNLKFLVRNTDGTYGVVAGDDNIFDGSWHFVIVQRSGDNLYMWIDGVQDGAPGSITGSLSSAAGLMIGGRVNGTYLWNGRLDDTLMWKKALSASERRWLWNNGNGQPDLISIPRSLVGGSLAHGRKGLVA